MAKRIKKTTKVNEKKKEKFMKRVQSENKLRFQLVKQ